MKSAPIPLLVAAVLIGSATAGAMTFLLVGGDASRPRRSSLPASTAAPSADAELPALQERLEELAAEYRDLSMRLATLEGRPAPAARAPLDGFVARADFEAFQKEVRASLTRSVPDSEPEELKEQVAGLLIDLRKQEAVTKVREMQEQRTARLDDDVQKLSEWLQLNAYQTQEMRGILASQYEREAEVRRRWEAGVDDDTLGVEKQAAREQFQGDLTRVLTPEQVETFWTRVSRKN